MRRNLLTTLFLTLLLSFGGRSEIIWLEKEYDFGLMKEEDGPKTTVATELRMHRSGLSGGSYRTRRYS